MEKAKQDDALTDLSNILGQLKEMAVDMGSEIERLVFYSLCISCSYMQTTLIIFVFLLFISNFLVIYVTHLLKTNSS